MSPARQYKIVLIIGIITIIIIIFSLKPISYYAHIYKNIFRLSLTQVQESLKDKIPSCNEIKKCTLLSGDILIRRHITERTLVIDKIANPYFTHSAFYLGDDQIVEAIGTEKNSEDDIQIGPFSKSDWMDVENFIIFRPKNYLGKLEIIKNNLKEIAYDPEYIFGLPEEGPKRATCADLIYTQLSKENIISRVNDRDTITPDYLFWVAKNNPDDFEIVGFNIK